MCVRFYKGHCVPKQPIRAIKTLKYSRIRIKCFVLFVFSKRDRLWKLLKAKKKKKKKNVYAKFYQNIPNGLRVKFHFFFRILTSAKPRPIPNVIWLYHGLPHVNINVYAKFHHNIPLSSSDRTVFTFFRIWSSAKPQPMKNAILQSLGLDLVNINVYAKVYKNIPLSSRDRAIFTFSEFGARQSLDQW